MPLPLLALLPALARGLLALGPRLLPFLAKRAAPIAAKTGRRLLKAGGRTIKKTAIAATGKTAKTAAVGLGAIQLAKALGPKGQTINIGGAGDAGRGAGVSAGAAGIARATATLQWKIEKEQTKRLKMVLASQQFSEVVKHPLTLMLGAMVVPELIKHIPLKGQPLIDQKRVLAMQATGMAVALLPVFSPYLGAGMQSSSNLANQFASQGATQLIPEGAQPL